MPFGSELIRKQRKLGFYKNKKIQTFQVTENRTHNFSYPQAGFWWLVERELVNLKGSLSSTIFREKPGLCVASSVVGHIISPLETQSVFEKAFNLRVLEA